MNDTLTKEQAEAKVAAFRQNMPTIDDIVTREPALLDVFYQAVRDTSENRWQVYEDYKKEMGRYAGWGAIISELRSDHYYELGVYAIDMVLPE